VKTQTTQTERRFASMLVAPPCFLAVARKMRHDGRADLFVTMPAIDGPIMRRLMILVSDQLAAGITDVVLDCAGVSASDVTDVGLGLLVKVANELDRQPRRGVLTLAQCGEWMATRCAPLLGGAIANLVITTSFPTTPHSPEAFDA